MNRFHAAILKSSDCLTLAVGRMQNKGNVSRFFMVRGLFSPFTVAISSAFLTTLAFPPFEFYFLAWVCLIPLILSIRRRSLKEAFVLGVIFGVLFFPSFLYWILNYSCWAFIGSVLVGVFSTATGFFGWSLLEKVAFKQIRLFVPALLWVVIEWGVQQELIALPLSFGITQAPLPIVTQVASVAGTYGISFLLVLSNSILASIIDLILIDKNYVNLKYIDQGRKIVIFWPLGFALLMMVGLVVGIGQPQKFESTDVEERTVAILQGNVQKSVLDTVGTDFVSNAINTQAYFGLMKEAADSRPNIVVWPETAVRRYVFNDHELFQQIKDEAARGNSVEIVGTPHREGAREYNSAFVVDSDGKIVGRYDKRALAPSEEFFVPGKDAKVFPTKHGKIGILICYESTLPYYSRELVNNGADYLFFLANDAGFGQSLEPYLHLNMAILRAVENHVFVVRAANTGISAVIDPNGRIVSKGTLNKKLVVHGKIHANYEPSIYSRFGDWFPPGCFILLCIACIPIMKTRLTIQGFFENPLL